MHKKDRSFTKRSCLTFCLKWPNQDSKAEKPSDGLEDVIEGMIENDELTNLEDISPTDEKTDLEESAESAETGETGETGETAETKETEETKEEG